MKSKDPNQKIESHDQSRCNENLAACEKQRDEYLAGWQRAKADFINHKREELSRLEDIARYATEDLLKDLIGTLDSFELGLAAMEKAGPVEKGVYMIKAQLEDLMRRRGIERIAITPGDTFNPAIAEAVAEVVAEYPPGSIAEEIEAGYKLHDKIVRPARVKVVKNI